MGNERLSEKEDDAIVRHQGGVGEKTTGGEKAKRQRGERRCVCVSVSVCTDRLSQMCITLRATTCLPWEAARRVSLVPGGRVRSNCLSSLYRLCRGKLTVPVLSFCYCKTSRKSWLDIYSRAFHTLYMFETAVERSFLFFLFSSFSLSCLSIWSVNLVTHKHDFFFF